ncbi:arylsulfatase J isoform X2 [Athalia rosae]|nr:arylsulfatase J isoform X2 [Athalia rosae]
MTGKHPIHIGMQHTVLFGAEPRGLPLNQKILPQYLEELGYVNHIVGKWHLGCYKKEYLPTFRGFRSHVGFWTGHQDYNDHTAMETGYWGLDMRRGINPAWDLHGQYSTDVFTREAVSIIDAHNKTDPLFLYLAHAAVHSGNPYNPLPAPDERVARFDSIEDYDRRRFAAMLSKLDDSVGVVVDTLRKRGMLQNSVIVFSSDNGGPAAGFNLNAASNWPLRGVKNTLWEGGVRGAGLIWSPLLQHPGRVSKQLFHVTDWLPTLIAAAGGDPSQLNIDGKNLWPSLNADKQSPRTSILHNIDDQYGNSAITVDDWKLLQGTTYNGSWDSWYGPSGRTDTYNVGAVIGSLTGRAVASVGLSISPERARTLRKEVSVTCAPKNSTLPTCKLLQAPCLYRIDDDPCENNNLANVYPEIVLRLQKQIKIWNSTAVTPNNMPLDPRGDPKFWDHTWTNFGDFNSTTNAAS